MVCVFVELEALQMPPTPPSSHGSDTEGSQSPVHPCTPSSPTQNPAVLKVAPRTTTTTTTSLSNSPLLTAPHVSVKEHTQLWSQYDVAIFVTLDHYQDRY